MFYLTTLLTHFIYSYMASEMLYMQYQKKKYSRCRGICYTNRGTLAGMINSSKRDLKNSWRSFILYVLLEGFTYYSH